MPIRLIETDELPRILTFYEDVISRTPNMSVFGRWKSGLYPTEAILRPYVEKGEMWGIVAENEIVATMGITDDGDSLGLHVLAVNPDHQGKGIGKTMIEMAITNAQLKGKTAVRLDALATNIPAHKLYLSLGFLHTHTEKLYADNTGWTDFYFFERRL